MLKAGRPISPHITIYKPQISSVLSILHRISGIINFFGLLTLVWWVIIMGAYGYTPEETFLWDFFSSMFGMLCLMGLSFSVIFHMCTGIRHLFWDAGYGFNTKVFPVTGMVVVFAAIIVFICFWIAIFLMRG